MKIDFHLHTRASFDCDSDPVQIVNWALKKGLNGLAVTDHDTTSGLDALKSAAALYGLFVIPAIEFTVARGTHYLVYLTPDVPLHKDDLEMIDEVHRRGGLIGLPHPYRSDTGLIFNQIEKSFYSKEEVDAILSQIDLIEVFNAKSTLQQNEQAQQLAESFPKLKRTAGSDSHHPSSVGAAHTEIRGFQYGNLQEMRQQLKSLPTRIVLLPELMESDASRKLHSAIEGVRSLMVKIKPVVPKQIWKTGKSIYRNSYNRWAEKRAHRSVVK